MQSEYIIKVSDNAPYQVHVGGQLALTVHAGPGGVHREWAEDWKNWHDLQNHAKMKTLVEK